MIIEWICDCCTAYLDRHDPRSGIGEDRCEDCIDHVEHCHEYGLCPRHYKQAGDENTP